MPSGLEPGLPGAWMNPAATASSGEYADPPTDPLVPEGDGVHTYRILVPNDVPFCETWYYAYLTRSGNVAADDPRVPMLASAWDNRIRPAVRNAAAVARNVRERRDRETTQAAEHNETFVDAPLRALLAERAAADASYARMSAEAAEALSKALSEPFDSGNENWIDARLSDRAVAGRLGLRFENPNGRWKSVAAGLITVPIGIMAGLSLGAVGGMVDFSNLSASKLPNLTMLCGSGLAVTFAAGHFIHRLFSTAAESRVLGTRREHVTTLATGFTSVAILVTADSVIVSHGLLRSSEILNALFEASGQSAPGSSGSHVAMYVASTFFMAAFAGMKAIQGWTAERAAVGNAIAYAREGALHRETSPDVRSAERAVAGLAEDLERRGEEFARRYEAVLARALPTDGRLSDEDKREISYAVTQLRGAMMTFDELWLSVFRSHARLRGKALARSKMPVEGARWKAS